MTWLTWRLLAGGGRARALMVLGCTAAVTVLLLLALTLVLLPRTAEEALYEVIADPGTRGGFVLAVLLLVLPPLLLLRQAVRFGTAARERRLAGLRVAGATPGDVRLLSTLEVALPALAGGALGVVGFWLLRSLAGGDPSQWDPALDGTCTYRDENGTTFTVTDCGSYLGGTLGQLVPRSVTPSWWMLLLVVLAVAAVGAVVGARLGGRLALSPHGVVRDRPARAPRPWGLLAVLVAVAVTPLSVAYYDWSDGLLTFVPIVIAVLGVVSLGPWVAHRAGARALRRTTRPAVLLASARLVADPRPAGRAAAAVGGIGLAGGGAVAFLVGLLNAGQAEAYYLIPLALVAGCLLVGLAVVCGTVAVHAVESLSDRRRSVAAQVAQGVPVEVLERSLRWEVGLVAVPLGVAGALLGGFALTALELEALSVGDVVLAAVVAVGAAAVMTVLVLAAVLLAVRAVRPAVRAAARPEHLRTA